MISHALRKSFFILADCIPSLICGLFLGSLGYAIELSCMCVPGACALEWKSVAAPWAKRSEGDENRAKKSQDYQDAA